MYNFFMNLSRFFGTKITKLTYLAITLLIACLGLVMSFEIYACSLMRRAILASFDTRATMLEWQDEHVRTLAESYAAETAVRMNESTFCDFDLDAALADPDFRLNDLQYVATHNSYKYGLVSEAYDFFNYVEFSNHFDYGNPDLTEQLNNGIRSLELDVQKVYNEDGSTGFECSHKYLFDNMSSITDFLQGLEEINMWSDYNPNHLPVLLLVEIKSHGFGDSPYETTLDDICYLAQCVDEIFGDNLYTPDQMLGAEYGDFADLRKNDGYPSVSDLLGKVIFMLHPGSLSNEYLATDVTTRSQPVFVGSDLGNAQNTDSVFFFVQNDPTDTAALTKLKDGNYVVRTRADKYTGTNRKFDKTYTAAINSGANILTTDYPYFQYKDSDRHTFSDNAKTVFRLK